MDSVLLLDLCVALATALCVGLLVYGAWLCLPELPRREAKGKKAEKASEDSRRAAA
jgi:hypothetical protein